MLMHTMELGTEVKYDLSARLCNRLNWVQEYNMIFLHALHTFMYTTELGTGV